MDLRKIILMAFVLSGMTALIYEITWIRPLQFVFGSTIYTASIIFAAFMGGLALGSLIIARYVDKIKNLPVSYGLLELGIGLYGVLLLIIFNILPDVYRAIYPLSQNFYLFEFIQFLVAFVILLIPTTLMGATFPIIARFYTKEKIGNSIGKIYSANNIGAIFGSFVAGFVLIPLFGIKASIIFAGIINILIAFVIISISSKDLVKKVIPLSIALFLIIMYFSSYNIKELYSGGLTRAGVSKGIIENTDFLYYNEGLYATVSVTKDPLEGARVLLINGKGQGSTAFQDLRINLLLAYLPLIFKPESEDALVIGLGTGVTSGHLAQSIKVKTLEIEPIVVSASEYFKPLNLNVLENSNHDLVIDDARNYLLKNKKKYDVIASELNDPWYSFSNPLFSKEFFELVNEDLNRDGIFIHWVPIYEFSVEDFRSSYKTFKSVFPYILAFANVKEDEEFPVRLQTSEIILVGSQKEIFDKKKIKRNFDDLSNESKEHLSQIWINSSDDLLNLLLFTNEEIDGYADNAELVTDDNLRLEFSTSRNILSQNPKEIILDFEKFLEIKKEGIKAGNQ